MIVQQAPSVVKSSLATRSRSGCVTCKAKHSKCDETRPTCKRCAAKGLTCGGYATGLKWSFKHQIFRDPGDHTQPVQTRTANVQGTGQAAVRDSVVVDASSSSSSFPAGASGQTVRRGSRSRASFSKEDDRSQRRDSNLSISTVSTVSTSIESYPNSAVPQASTRQQEQQQDDTKSVVVTSCPGAPQAGYVTRPGTSFLNDSSSAFIVNWFQEVCPAWSGFDSDVNWNRKIATELWQSSMTVKSALESMSASFLASRLPGLRMTSLRLMQRATEYIQAELEAVKGEQILCTVPTGLLFSMFCLGTTICWVDSRGLGLPFFRESRALLRRLNAQRAALNATSSATLDFFNKSLVYCDMLLAVVHDDRDMDTGQALDSEGYAQAEPGETRAVGTPLHPWTGISTLSSRLFADSVRLCRMSRSRLRQTADPQACFTQALDDLLRAQQLEEQLLALEFDPEQRIGDTADLTTPESHLTMVAEAYRLSSLLHLYQTFPDLAFQRLPTVSAMPAGTDTLWREWIAPLALHLVKILENIPPSSGSRVIQPLLYISASTGLRHSCATSSSGPDLSASLRQGRMSPTGWGLPSPAPFETPAPRESDSLTSYVTQITDADHILPSGSSHDVALDVGRARHFIMKRLGILESTLPPAPIVVAKELVSAIWEAYDNGLGGGLQSVHWIDVMELHNLRSMFG